MANLREAEPESRVLPGTHRAYRLVNVFAEAPFTGATVAVFTDATGLETAQMAAIARELNLPQTAFVFPPQEGSESPRVRIFTPTTELPSAGLPMIATVFALKLESGSRFPLLHQERDRVVLEQTTGPVSVTVFSPILTVRQNVPVFGATFPERETVAALLSLRSDQLGTTPLQTVSSGVPYLVVPLKNAQALSQIRIRESIWERTLQYFESPSIIAFALRGTQKGIFAQLRVFSPGYGIIEESGAEMAAGPLVAYVLRYALASLPETNAVILRQGDELGRPALLHVSVELAGDQIASLRVGGQCIQMGDGRLFV